MASLRASALAMVGGLAGTVAVAGMFVTGCGDDSGTDGGEVDSAVVDSTVGDTAAPDTGLDTGAKDSANDAKDSSADAKDSTVDATDSAVEADAGHDGDAARADADAGHDADSGSLDSSSDSSDAMDAADTSDGRFIPPGLLDYPNQYAEAFCTGIASCCGLDAGGFDFPNCEKTWSSGGWDFTLPFTTSAYGDGLMTFDAAKAATCVTALRNWPCGTFGSTQNQAILDACLGVLGGLSGVDGGCASSFECATGSYCAGATCAPLLAQGATCTSSGEAPDRECTNVGTQLPALFCNIYADGGTSTTGVCDPLLADGGVCANANSINDLACAGKSCGDDNLCGDPETNPWIAICPGLILDAGAD